MNGAGQPQFEWRYLRDPNEQQRVLAAYGFAMVTLVCTSLHPTWFLL